MIKHSPKPPRQDGEDDLAILHPERTATIAGVHITMREYGFVEGIRLSVHVKPVVAALSDTCSDGESITPDNLRPAFAEHADDVCVLMAAACDQPESWVRALGDSDGQALMLLWWVTNADFFVRRVIEAVTIRQIEQASAGQMSTPPSSPPATTPTGSASTRVGN